VVLALPYRVRTCPIGHTAARTLNIASSVCGEFRVAIISIGFEDVENGDKAVGPSSDSRSRCDGPSVLIECRTTTFGYPGSSAVCRP
jgi:hypothetical protein